MTPQDRAEAGSYGPARPPRPVTGERAALPGALAQVQAALEAALPGALAAHEARMRVLAQGLVASAQSAELTQAERSITRLRRWAALLGLVAGTAAASCATRFVAEQQLAVAAEQVAESTAQRTSAELEERHDDTREQVAAHTHRIAQIESKIDRVLELLAQPREPAPAPAPKPGRRR